MHDIRWSQFPYVAQRRVGLLGTQKFSPKDRVLQSKRCYVSVSGGPSIPSLYVKNCDLHSNSIMPTSKSVPPGHEHDWATVQIAVFDSQWRGWSISACWFIANYNILIEELKLSTSQVLILTNLLLCYIWKLASPDITHAINLPGFGNGISYLECSC